MDINESRKQIDLIDDEIVSLFTKRMEVSKEIAKYKKENNLTVYDSERERALLEKVENLAGEEYGDYIRKLYSTILEISKACQNRMILGVSELAKKIENAVNTTPRLFPEKAVVACQGVEGAHSMHACEKLFEKPSIMYCQSFEAVFQSVESGLCKYGVVPLENSTAGSVNQIYSLMSKYKFSIVRSTKMQIEHSLLAKKGAKLSDIKEIYSHPQAISQCSEFLSSLDKNIKVIPCENTALAAKKVAESGDNTIAAIASIECAEHYGIDVLSSYVQNTSNNYTRFICFSKTLEIYPGADRTSLLIKAPHKPGSLYSVMAYFHAFGINILKLESRPIPESDFEFMFYFDLEVPVYSEKLGRVMDNLISSLGEQHVKYLGSYREA